MGTDGAGAPRPPDRPPRWAVAPRVRSAVERGGVRIAYEVFGEPDDARPWVLLLPSWSIIHSRVWKHQVPHLARHFRVVTFDGRGNGRSDRPRGPEQYTHDHFVADAVAVLDAAGAERAVAVGLSMGGHWAALLAARHPERVAAAVLIAPAAPLGVRPPERARYRFSDVLDTEEGWARFNRHSWLRDYEGFARFFMEQTFSEPYSSRGIEDGVAWALETGPEVLIDTVLGAGGDDPEATEAEYRAVRCPVSVLHGTEDRVIPHRVGERVAELTGGRLVSFEGSGHGLPAREPVRVNLLLEDLVRGAPAVAPAPPAVPRSWTPGRARPRRALFLSSPIGLGHARRDLAIARELRGLRPGLEIDWLAQHPVTTLLRAAGERVHPASRLLASEAARFEALARNQPREHALPAYRAYRDLDEVFTANFMLFQEVVEEGLYDLVVADEAWEVDHHWHENPELKRGAYAWLTDFVGFLHLPGEGRDESRLVEEDNARMIEHLERHRRVRDLSLFAGEPDDVVDRGFGGGLPRIRPWTQEHYLFVGAVPGLEPALEPDRIDRAALRAELGWGAEEPVCVAAVGGSAVGGALLRKLVAAFPEARRRVPGLHMVAVAGPRIDPASVLAGVERPDGLEIHAYVHDLPRHLAACDLAVVQGGLGTTLELTALRRPFLYVPVRGHFEQQIHVRHRLERHCAGHALDFAATEDPEILPRAIAVAMNTPTDGYLPVPTDGAARAARLLAGLL